MSRRIAIVIAGALAACESTPGDSASGAAKLAESGTLKGSAGGFSATMSAELARAGIGEPAIAPPPSPPPAAGSAGASAAGSAGAPAAAATTPAAAAATGSAGAPAAAATGSAGAPAASATGSAAPAASTMAAAPPNTTSGAAAPASSAAASKTTSTAKAIGAIPAPAKRSYVKPSADVAAIKFDLEPNWERDMGEAGTFSLVVKIPGTDDTRLFAVRYGYEDQAAGVDCDQYRKFLEDKRMMKVTLNRQRGSACYIEGTDQGGVVAFRFLLTYGGKRLMCHGSLYKDPASAALGDLRDKVLMQAKKICETLAL